MLNIPFFNQTQPGAFADLFQYSAVAAFAIDPTHTIIFWNKACEELTGVNAAEMLGTCNHWRAFYPQPRPCLADFVISRSYDQIADLYEKYGRSKLVPGGLHGEGWYRDIGGKKRYMIFDAAPVYNREEQLVAAIETLQDITDQRVLAEENERQIVQLKEALQDNPCLKGFLPLCACCKKIRDGMGRWVDIEKYIRERTGVDFTHSLCRDCARRLYPDFYKG